MIIMMTRLHGSQASKTTTPSTQQQWGTTWSRILLNVFIPRGLSHRTSVRLSACHTPVLCPHGSTYDRDLFTMADPPHDSSFLAPNFVSTFQRFDFQIQGQIQVGLVPRSMTLNDIWRSFQPMSLPRPISRKLNAMRPQKLKLLISKTNHTTPFRWYDDQWSWRYFKVIGLFYIKFLVNNALSNKSYYRVLIGNHTLAFEFRLVPLVMTLKDIWRSFQSRLSLQQSLAGFRVARSLNNSWASCYSLHKLCTTAFHSE